MGWIGCLVECEEASAMLELLETILAEGKMPLFSNEIFLSLNLVLIDLVAANGTWELDELI